jgi:hypothetical protein
MTTCPLNPDINQLVWGECSLGHVNNIQCKNFHSHVKFFAGKSEYELLHSYLFNTKEVKYIVKSELTTND